MYNLDDLTENDYSNDGDCDSIKKPDEAYFYGPKKSAGSQSGFEVKKLNDKTDQLFFEFFGAYTKESINSHKKSGNEKRKFNARSIQLNQNDY